MTEELQQVAEQPAPEQETTAVPVTETSTPETPSEPAKSFSQEELDQIVAKRLAREQRKWEREQAQRLAELKASVTPPAETPPDQVPDVMALAERIAQQREEAKRRAEIEQAYREREEDARDKYQDFEQVAYNPALPITQPMAETIHASDVGPEIAYFLGTNPQEAQRIARLSPFLQAKELGRIEAKLLESPPAKKTTSAPPPIAPLSARSAGSPAYDTTDPRSVKSMSTSEWIEAERQRQAKRLESQRLR